MKQIKGIGVSSGVAIGKAWIWENSLLKEPEYAIDESSVDVEVQRFNKALESTEIQIREMQRNFERQVGNQYSDIFSFHLAFLKDAVLKNETENIIRDEKINSESALTKVIQKLGREFRKKETDFFKDRRRDLLDVIEKIVLNLRGSSSARIKTFKDEIIVARDLSPSQTVSLDKNRVIGFVTEIGSETSHAAIIAKALEIPAVVAENAAGEIKNGDAVIVDGTAGIVIVNPVKEVVDKYRGKKKEIFRMKERLLQIKNLPCQTLDGKRVHLHANIELPEEVETAKKYGAEGIGLYRTEYLYLNRKDLPSEEEQFLAYKNVAEKIGAGKPVIIRTIDIGGDKFISALPATVELNPFLGWRGIRFCLERKDIFKIQLRAILRAAVYGNLKIMFPMISTIEEIRAAKKMLQGVKAEMKKEKKRFNGKIEVGIMVETPSAALITDKFAGESDFFSIGSNDLVQYTLAVDRGNEKISHLYQPCHPAVLKLIRMTVENSRMRGIWTGLCGEMASIPEIACLLVGTGVDELSMAPGAIPAVKEKIRSVHYGKLKEIAEKVLVFDTHEKVYNYLLREIK
ncbi:MAG: phosphoenolpyruvate--protein phosphotransferase [Candidatus Omnitrophica bacterium]|nr:phosphoenolpyruvate--protein phosphotransferase [Candidatus Omnitrophota bacterium]